MLKILVVVVGILLGSILLVVGIGYTLPVGHVAARAIVLRQKPANVFELISNVKEEPAWRRDVQRVEILPEENGNVRFREVGTHGALTMAVVESTSPLRMATRIEDKNLPFGGGWIFEITPTAGGCGLNITERGEIHNPVFRFVSRFIIGYDLTLDTYLKSVGQKFGESVVISDGRLSDGQPAEQ
jgi:hypothetical protein